MGIGMGVGAHGEEAGCRMAPVSDSLAPPASLGIDWRAVSCWSGAWRGLSQVEMKLTLRGSIEDELRMEK